MKRNYLHEQLKLKDGHQDMNLILLPSSNYICLPKADKYYINTSENNVQILACSRYRKCQLPLIIESCQANNRSSESSVAFWKRKTKKKLMHDPMFIWILFFKFAKSKF